MNWLRRIVVVLLISACVLTVAQAAEQKVTARLDNYQVTVNVDGKLFTSYKFADTQKYPYFWPVNGPESGKSITTETSQPYPHHHSLFFGCDRINGGNYWQDVNQRGQIVSQGLKIIEAAGKQVVFTDECLWRRPGTEPIISDTRRVVVTAPSEDVRLIDFEISLKPLVDIEILKTNHALFSARVVPELSVKSGGTLINAEGKTSEKGHSAPTLPGAITPELATASRKGSPSCRTRTTDGSRANGLLAITDSSRRRRCTGSKEAN